MSADEIRHDKQKKTIYYKNARLKIYDKKVFYFPKFFHPDPTVKRQSGFLTPKLQDNDVSGLSFNWDTIAIAIGSIITAVAVFDIHIDINAVAIINPRITFLTSVPIMLTILSAILL